MKFKKKLVILSQACLLLFLIAVLYFSDVQQTGFSILGSDGSGLFSSSRTTDYYLLIDSLFSNGNSTQLRIIQNESLLWVPWFDSSSSCDVNHLVSGSLCNITGNISMDQNCMVTDEFSQVGIMLSMSNNQSRMNSFYNTILQINSSYGSLPGWRVSYINNSIEPCKEGINSNCDTASDADARIILSLYAASTNNDFSSESDKLKYRKLADEMLSDFLEYEVTNECYPSSLGEGDICYWLSSGSVSNEIGGLSSTNFAYTGYYPDAILALLSACSVTGNQSYCNIATNISLNYLQASNFDNSSFSVPPGKSFKWTNLSGIPFAECTDTCSPDKWDQSDAPRALMMCSIPYYFSLMGLDSPTLNNYCNLWFSSHLGNSNSSAVIAYYSDGSASESPESSLFAQGLQTFSSFFLNDTLLTTTLLDESLSHYSPSEGTWDSQACFGVYRPSIPLRALGSSIGLDSGVFIDNSFGPIFFSSISHSSKPIEVIIDKQVTISVNISNSASKDPSIKWYLNGLNVRSTNSSSDSYTFSAGSTKDIVSNLSLYVSTNNGESLSHYFELKTIEDSSLNNILNSGGGGGSSSSSSRTTPTTQYTVNTSNSKKASESLNKSNSSYSINYTSPLTGKPVSSLVKNKINSGSNLFSMLFILLFLLLLASSYFLYKRLHKKSDITLENPFDETFEKTPEAITTPDEE